MTRTTTSRVRPTFSGGEYVASLMAELNRAEISKRIRQARTEAGFKNREQLADVLRVHRRTIEDWEDPKHQNVPWDRLEEIAQVTGKTKGWLLHGEQPEEAGRLETVDRRLGSLEVDVVKMAGQLHEAVRLLRAVAAAQGLSLPEGDEETETGG